MLLRITDGTTTITLNNDGGSVSTGLIGARYFPITGDGETTTEPITVAFAGTSSNALSSIREIKRLLSDAKVRQTEMGNARVYLEYQISSSDSVYRSEIIDGRDDWGESKQLRQIYESDVAGELTLFIERLDWWEASASVSVGSATIRNGNTSPYNIVTLSTIPGSLPTPLSIECVNAAGATLNARSFYLNVDAFAGMTTNQHLLIPSTATVSWTGSTTHSSILYALPLSATILSKLAGKSINVIAAFSSITSGIYLRAGLYSSYGGVYAPLNTANEQYVVSSRTMFDLGTLEVPKVATGGLVVVITAYATVTGSATLSFAQVAPSSNAMKLEAAYTMAVGEKVGHDAIEDVAYFVSGGVNYPTVRKSGGPLFAYPGRTNRLHLLFDEHGSFNASRQMTVTVACRPRRRSI